MKNKSAFAAFLLAAFITTAFTGAAQAAELEVLVPESLTDVSTENTTLVGDRRMLAMSVLATTGKKVMLVGRVDKPQGVKIEIINNKRMPVSPTMHKGYFHAGVVLSLGVNLIEIRWKRGDGPWNTKNISLFRSTATDDGLASDYPPYVFHRSENEKNCEGCHQMRLTQEEIETGMEKNCLVCHTPMVENVYVHGPVTVGVCTVCHDPESSPNRYIVQDTDDVLCYGCHTDRSEIDHSKALLHGPVGAGLCTICHDPHSSPFEFQLVKSRATLCAICHQEDVDRWINEDNLHPPFRDGNCAGCHDPHSSDFEFNLKVSREEICALCHQIPPAGHLHPVGKRPQFGLPEGFPLNESGRTMCLTCHDPHGAKGPGMTRLVGCEGCHPK